MLRKVCESSFWDISIRALVGFLPFRPRLEFTVQAFCIAGEFGIGEADWFAGFVEGLSGSFPVDKVAYLSTKFLVLWVFFVEICSAWRGLRSCSRRRASSRSDC